MASASKQISKSFSKIPKWFSKQPRSTQAAIVLVMCLAAWQLGPASNMSIISGYDGIISTIHSVESDYDLDFMDESSAGIDSDGPWWAGDGIENPTGLMIEIQSSVNVISYNTIDVINETIDNGDDTYTHKYWTIQIVHCNYSATIRTYGDGLGAVTDVEFWIQLQENDFSIFQEADESYAYIIETYTTSAATIKGIMEVVPGAGGYTFPLTTVKTSTVPAWLLSSGYTGNLASLSKVKYVIRVEKASPEHFWGWFRSESSATLHMGVDVFLAGYWEHTTTYKKWEPPILKPNWLDSIFIFLGSIVTGLADFLNDIGMGFIMPIAIIVAAALGGYMLIRAGTMKSLKNKIKKRK